MVAVRALAVSVAIVLGVAACGKDSPAAKDTTTTSPEQRRTSAADVASGLHDIDGIVGRVAAAVQAKDGTAKTTQAQIEPAWQKVEGTVKANDANAYLTFEEAFGLIGTAVEKSDAAGAQTAAQRVSTAVATYLAAYPG